MKSFLLKRMGKHLSRSCQPVDEKASALVLTPHFDDETLGCGSTILRKRSAMAPVYLVFCTDGTASHRHLMEPEELSRIRHAEAIEAADALNVPSENIHFLDFPDGRLQQFTEQGIEMLADILANRKPRQVFIPALEEPPLWSLDHISAANIGLEAVRRSGISAELFEYPIWIWYHWPWIKLPYNQRETARTILSNSVRYRSGLFLLRRTTHYTMVGNTGNPKRIALHHHRSQVSELIRDVQWPTLYGLSDGEFVSCFFNPWEIFWNRHIQQN